MPSAVRLQWPTGLSVDVSRYFAEAEWKAGLRLGTARIPMVSVEFAPIWDGQMAFNGPGTMIS